MTTLMKTKVALAAALLVGTASVGMAASDYSKTTEHHYATGGHPGPGVSAFGPASAGAAAGNYAQIRKDIEHHYAAAQPVPLPFPQAAVKPFSATEQNEFARPSRWGW